MQEVTLNKGGVWVLVATILGSSMVWIDSSALNVALDAIQQDLGATVTELIWIVNIYLLMLASFILISGSLGDHYGRKRVYAIGITVFTVASVACGLAPTTLLLIIARAVQGLGGALMVPGSLAIITASIAAQDRGRAVGIWSASSAVTTLIGPVLGGALASAGLWRAVFFLTVPIAVTVFLVLPRVPESRDKNASKQLDYLGAALLALGLGALTFGALQLGDVSGLNTRAFIAIVAIIGGLVLLALFIVVERRSDHPMVDLALFKSRTFTGTNAMTACLYAGLGGALLFVPLNLIQVQGYSATLAGLATLTISLALALLSPLAGSWVQRVGPRILLTVGPALAGAGFALLALPGVTNGPSDYWLSFFPGMLVLGVGLGITVAPLTTTVMSAAPSDKSGVASGVNNAVTRTAQALATGLLGAVMIFAFSSALDGRLASLQLPPAAQAQLQQSAAQLGATPVPDELDQQTQDTVQLAIKQSFVAGFRLVVGIAAVLAWISAALSWWLIEPRVAAQIKASDDDEEEAPEAQHA